MKILRVVKFLIIGIYVACGVALAVFLWPRSGWHAYRVATGSMTPAIPQGSLVLVHSTSPRNYHVGDVVTYINPYNTRETITHRIVQTGSQGGIPSFVTRGDANKANDKPILGGNIVGRVQWHVPHIGNWLAQLKKPWVLIVLVFIPALVIIIDELRILFRKLQNPAGGKPVRQPVPQAAAATAGAGGGAALTPTRPAQPHQAVNRPPARSARRARVDSIARHGIIILAIVAALGLVGKTYAQLTSQAKLTDSSILINNAANNGGNPGTNPCPPTSNSSVSIANTAPGSTNRVDMNESCSVTSSNNTSVNVTNNSSQTVTSGSATASEGQNATSGSVSASSNINTSVTVGP